MGEEILIGKVTHYYNNLGVGIIDLIAPIVRGQTVHFRGTHDDFLQEVKEMQYDHKEIEHGLPGQQVGLRVDQKVHKKDQVYAVAY